MKRGFQSARRTFLKQALKSGVAVVVVPRLAWAASRDKIRIGQIGTRHAHAQGKLQTIRKLDHLYDGEFLDLAKVIRAEKKLAWDSAHDLTVHGAVLRASGMPVE